MSEVPEGFDLGQELRRKSFEALQYLISRTHSAQLTEEQFNTGVDVLFMAVSGLVPEPVTAKEAMVAILASPTFSSEEATKHRYSMSATQGPRFIDVITACQNEIEHVYPVQRTLLYSKEKGIFKAFRWQAGDSFVDCTTCITGSDPATNRIKCADPVTAKAKFDELQSSDTLQKFGFKVLP